MCSSFFKRRSKTFFQNRLKKGLFHKPKTCLGMRDITLRLALIQSLVVQLKIFEIKNVGTLNFAATSPMLSKHCEQISILDVDFICGGFMNKHYICATI